MGRLRLKWEPTFALALGKYVRILNVNHEGLLSFFLRLFCRQRRESSIKGLSTPFFFVPFKLDAKFPAS